MPALPAFLIIGHFLADWPPAQTTWMALNKNKSWKALSAHVATYTALIAIVTWFATWDRVPILFSALTFASHFITDAITSRLTTHFWYISLGEAEVWYDGDEWVGKSVVNVDWKKRSIFFFIIGLDQCIHALTLAYTWQYAGRV